MNKHIKNKMHLVHRRVSWTDTAVKCSLEKQFIPEPAHDS